jgi:hypothetical protein
MLTDMRLQRNTKIVIQRNKKSIERESVKAWLQATKHTIRNQNSAHSLVENRVHLVRIHEAYNFEAERAACDRSPFFARFGSRSSPLPSALPLPLPFSSSPICSSLGARSAEEVPSMRGKVTESDDWNEIRE